MNLHASSVVLDGRGLLILGPSGAGKSSLALALMALGARLVADDRTLLTRAGDALLADAPAALRGRIEARHVGILAAAPAGPAPIALAVELGHARAPRLPAAETLDLLGVALPCLRTAFAAELAPALAQYLRGGRIA